MNQVLVRTAATVLVLALAAAVVRLILGADAGWILFAFGLLGLLAYHAKNLGRLLQWLGRAKSGEVPEAQGIWDDAFALLHRRERRNERERQRIERLLVRYRQAGRALPDAVVLLDLANRIQWCNDKAENYLGIDAEADVEQPVTNLVRQPEFAAYLASGDYSQPLQLRSARGAGSMLSVQIVPYVDAQKLLLARDVTQAERLETMQRDFVANVSHELRTPLTVLAGFLETIRELKLDPERSREYLGMMSEQATRMQRIIDDLLALSALESSPEAPRDERVDVRALLERLCADAQTLSAGRHRVALAIESEFDLLGAGGEIASAFGNLVTNAVRYTPAGGEVRLAWRAAAGGADFTVEDTGIGIAPEHIPRLTERFYRVDHGRSRDTGGTGLGLAIVKHALLRHQAVLEIKSEPGKGSRFSAHFPARRLLPAGTASTHDVPV